MVENNQLEHHENPLLARIEQLHQEIEGLHRTIAFLEESNRDLEMTLQTVTEHGDVIEAELQVANRQLQVEIRERQRAEARLQALVEVISRQKSDLEIILDTLREHGDIMDAQWYERVNKVQYLAAFDGLTQIPNRRRFDEHLNLQWRQMAREQLSLSIIMCDVDYFKQYNDTYGHLAGDTCLQRVAKALFQTAQHPGDLVARYGGEEFAAILPQTNLNGALMIATKMQNYIAQLYIPHPQSSVSPYVTLSIGVVSAIPDIDRSPRSLLDEADRYLYLAKQLGRNRIVHAPPSEAHPSMRR